MSNFICEKCGKPIIDTQDGYVTECNHYPMEYYVDITHWNIMRNIIKLKVIKERYISE